MITQNFLTFLINLLVHRAVMFKHAFTTKLFLQCRNHKRCFLYLEGTITFN